jgi:glycosyltransferase involved in cell wall biosynthesis
MRVLMLSKACLVGLYQRKLEHIAAHPAVTALQVLVPPFWRDERGEMPLERAYTQGYDLCTTPMHFNGSFHLHYYPDFGRAAAAFRPDLIHIDEEPYNLATWLALRTAQKIGARSLFFSWQNIARRYPPPFAWGEAWVLKNIDYALMGTESAGEVWRAKGYQKPYAVLPQFGVDVDLFQPPAQLHTGPLRIGYIGRLVREKGVDLLLWACHELPAADWSLQIIGGGPEEANLRALAESLGLGEKITWGGQVPSMQMPALYAGLDVLVLPSRTLPNWKEQFGRVLIEAMAAGVVVVGSDSGAIPDVIGPAGLVFREEDAGHLCEHLAHLLKDAGLRAHLAKRGRERAESEFSHQGVAAQSVAAYQAALGQ